MKVPFIDIKKQYDGTHGATFDALKDIFETCTFVGGPYVNKFEDEMEDYLGVKHAIGCANGTDALRLALAACGIKPGDEVITTAFSFFATAEAIASVGAKAVFVDILPYSYVIDPDKIEDAITDRTKAILPVHIFGACCDMDAINDIAKRHGLKVIEDCAQAAGAMYKHRHVGTFGDVGCFSFYPTKNLGCCGDGGMCTTNSDDIATMLLALREHGAGRYGVEALKLLGEETVLEANTEKVTAFYDPYKYFNYLIGTNSRLDSIQAAILSINLQRLDNRNKWRAAIAKMYSDGLTDKIIKPYYDIETEPCWHQYAILVPEKDRLISYLADNGIGTGNFYPVPLHKQKAFNENNCGNYGACLPIAEEVCKEIVCLPIYPGLSSDQVMYVIEKINSFFSPAFKSGKSVFIHHTADVSNESTVGGGTKIWNNSQVRENATIGEDCSIGKNVYIDTSVKIGDRAKIQNNVNIYHGVVVEDDVFLGPSMTFTNDLYPRASSEDWITIPTFVRKGASIGANATIICGATIGEHAMVGAGSVVTKDVKPHALVVGNPARQIGWVCKCGQRVTTNGQCPKCGEAVSYVTDILV